MNKNRLTTCILLLISVFALSACIQGAPDNGGTETSEANTAIVPTKTPVPMQTPTAVLDDVIMIVPPGSNGEVASDLEDTLRTLSEKSNLIWSTRSSLQEGDLHNSLRIVVALDPYPDLAFLAERASQIQFLGVGIEDLEITENLSRITTEALRWDVQGFLAGYVAAMIAPDWRAGVISHIGDANGRAASEGFMQGARYFCGQCRPSYPPYSSYPIALNLELPSSSWEAEVGDFLQNSVKVVYIYPEIDNPELHEYFALNGVAMIGGDGSLAGEIPEYWIATMKPEPSGALMEMWEPLLNGDGGLSKPMPLVFKDVNRKWLSEGRERLAMATLEEILDGFIDTGVDPITGERQ